MDRCFPPWQICRNVDNQRVAEHALEISRQVIMRIHVLGTAAAKPVPRFFCNCRGCVAARAEGGRSLRTRSSTSIYLGDDGPANVRYKVDFGPDAQDHTIRFGESINQLEHLLITHAHADHLHPYWLSLRRQAISSVEDMPMLHVWGNWRVWEVCEQAGIDLEANRITKHCIEPDAPFRAGALEVFPLAAMHPDTDPALNFVITAEGTTVLTAWDTGFWPEPTWASARISGLTFDAVIMELTVNGPDGPTQGQYHHNPDSFLEMKQRMLDEGLLADGARFFTTHMGDNGQLSHSEAQEYWAPHGVSVGYDGLLIEL